MSAAAIKLIREMALIRANVTDQTIRDQLLAPMERQLKAIADEQARQSVIQFEEQAKPAKEPPKK